MAEPQKFFDVAHPGMSVPPQSARPIIAQHKIMTHDPMMSGSDNPSEVESEEKPIAPSVPTVAKTVEPVLEEVSPEDSEPENTKEEPQPEEAENTEQPATILSNASSADVPTAEEKEHNADVDKLAKQKAELEQKAVQNKATEKLIEDKTYFVKISLPERRRSAIRIIIIAAVVFLLTLIAVDLLVDAKIIKTSIPPVVDLIRN
jgi:type IV secretory pathway VirB10-like protein